MRKRTVNHVADTVFWYLLYFLPVLAYLLYLMGASRLGNAVNVNFDSFIGDFTSLMTNNTIYTSLYSMFGESGIIPIFQTNGIFLFFTYFISVYLLHLMVDFILFVPRIAHKWLKEFTRGD